MGAMKTPSPEMTFKNVDAEARICQGFEAKPN
jgi:hypothetical protein